MRTSGMRVMVSECALDSGGKPYLIISVVNGKLEC